MAKHEEFLKQVKERDAAFKVYGTDGCRRCDTGRITLFVKREVCEKCDGFSPVPTTYGHSDIPKLLAIIEKLKTMVSHYESCATVNAYDDEVVECDCGLEKEIAAIDRGGA